MVCLVNYKGGVGKTVTAVNIAAYLALEHRKRVLLVDLDPQTSATFHLMPQDEEHQKFLGYGIAWREWRRKHGTLYNILKAYADKKTPPPISEVIVRDVITRGDQRLRENLHLLPGDISLIDIDIYLEKLPLRGLDILSNELEKVKEDYAYILFDCPPNLYGMTKSGLFTCDHYVIPVLPDYLSTLGIYELVNRIEIVEKALGKRIDCKGVIFSRVDRRYAIHDMRMQQIKNDPKLLKRNITTFSDPVRNIAALQYSGEACLPVCVYAPLSLAALDYQAVTKEFKTRI